MTQQRSLEGAVLLRKLRNSDKYAAAFKKSQQEAAQFFKAYKNLSFAMQRFDSLTTPLFKIYNLLRPTVGFLASMTKTGDSGDQKWAKRFLELLTREDGGQNLAQAAIVADCLMILQKFLRLDDKSEGSVVLKASEAPANKL